MSYENVPKNPAETAVLVQELSAIEVKPVANWSLDLAAGRITGKSAVHIFGRNPDIDIASGFEDIWDGGGTYTGFDASVAETVSIVSDSVNDTLAGTGARTVRIQGLGVGFVEQEELIDLNGTTPVVSTLTYLRCADCAVVAAGSLQANDGVITGNQSTTTSVVFFVMNLGNNGVLSCLYTVPFGKLAYINNGFATAAKKGSSSAEVKASVRFPGTVFQIVEWFAVNSTGSSYVPRDFEVPLIPLPAGTDIRLSADVESNNTAIAAGLEIILEDVPV